MLDNRRVGSGAILGVVYRYKPRNWKRVDFRVRISDENASSLLCQFFRINRGGQGHSVDCFYDGFLWLTPVSRVIIVDRGI